MNKRTFFTLGEAAKQVGKSKPTLSHAIKTGKLSVYEKTENGYKIDAAELFRVFPPNSSMNGQAEQTLTPETEQVDRGEHPASLLVEVAELRAKLESANLRITDKDRVIDDLRHRLDLENEERRKLSTMLLTYQAPPPAEHPKGLRAKLARWIGGKKG